ncbi:MAG: FecR domain-containing protein [Chitinophagaceae bacterium]
MNENVSKISALITKFLNNDLDEEGKNELAAWKEKDEDNRRLFEKLTNEDQLFNAVSETYTVKANIYDKLKQNVPELNEANTGKVVSMQRFSWRRMTATAAIILAIASGAYLWVWRDKKQQIVKNDTQVAAPVNDVEPGRDGAILKLANGQEIILDSAANGGLARQGNTSINKQGSLLAYNSGDTKNSEALYNTLSTPIGRQFRLILPDGSKIWLNAASVITYPTAFIGKERNVTVKGEVYMEVAKDASKPFRVHILPTSGNGEETTVEVLGTSFNINGYGDELAVRTTLLEGSVKIMKGKSIALLKPGQQAFVDNNKIGVKNNADIEKETAWKNGLFYFTNDKLKNIMQQISRWYDVDVVYEDGDVQNIGISGKIERNANLSEMLKILTYLNVEYRIEGRKLILSGK